MKDCFAVLGQPRRAWLDPAELKEAYHAMTRREHPDAQPAGEGNAFAEVNEAYRVLRDPKERLQHLLELEGQTGQEPERAIPAEMAALFEPVARATQAAERALRQSEAATNVLSRSLAGVERETARRGVEEMRETLFALYARAEDETRAADELSGDARIGRLRELRVHFAYLTRWIAQLEERRTQLL